jgi:Uma2 family endonuclease
MERAMATSPIDHKFSYQEYRRMPEGERWEIINGEGYAMTQMPLTLHQGTLMSLIGVLGNALAGRKCRLLMGPCDVVLSDYDVVEPDVFVVFDEKQLTKENVVRTPGFVIEILSPSTGVRDQREKRFLYERYGVREYLIVDPVWQLVHRFLLGEDGKYGISEIFDAQDEIALVTLPGVTLPLWTVFEVEKKEKKRQTPGRRTTEPRGDA